MLPLSYFLSPTIPHKVVYKNKSRCGRKEENTGDEKGFSTFLWCSFFIILGGVVLHQFFPFLLHHHFGWCGFLGGRKLDDRNARKLGDC